MKIENPAALRFIMQDDIYLLPADKGEQLTSTIQPVVETELTGFNYLGEHKKNFLVVVYYTNEEFMAAAHINALQNILKRKDYSLDDVAIFNRFTYPEVDFEQMQAFFNPQKMLLLGKNALPSNAPSLTFNLPIKVNGYDALYTFSFDEMMDNTANKITFWDQMKNL